MKANEFVKKFGWDEAISKLEDCIFLNAESFDWLGCNVVVDDLKQLIEAKELVDSYGGLDDAKKCLLLAPYAIDKNGAVDALKQAIQLVEQCQ